MAITTTSKLLTSAWATDVEAAETAVGRFRADHAARNDCQVVFFEMVSDGQLHVNVTHKHLTRSVRGWAGPASLPQGFVHNRRFNDAQTGQIVRQVREMVFAERI
jgi:hypothetical protein